MALIKNPGGGVAASGSIGGTTYARNRAGQYARAWAKPINPGTARQSSVRGTFTASATAWAQLTSPQIAAWQEYAQQLVRLNRLGEPYTPTGRQIFMEVHQNLTLVGEAPLTDPSAFTEAPALVEPLSLTVESEDDLLTAFTATSSGYIIPGGGDKYLIMQASPPLEPKITNANNRFRQFATSDAISSIGSLAYNELFGQLPAPAGNNIFARVRVIDQVSGLSSPWYRLQSEIVAVP